MKEKELTVSVKYGNTVNYETIQASQSITIEINEKDDTNKIRQETRAKLLKECKEFVQDARK